MQTYTYIYFTTLDIVSKLGGIGATIKITLSVLAPFLILKYMFRFAEILLRKSNQRIRIFKLKDIKKALPEIRERVEAYLPDEEAKEHLKSIGKCSEDFKTVKLIIS